MRKDIDKEQTNKQQQLTFEETILSGDYK